MNKKQPGAGTFLLFVLLVAVLLPWWQAGATAARQAGTTPVAAEVTVAIANNGRAPVLILLEMTQTAAAREPDGVAQDIRARQAQVVDALEPAHFTLAHRYQTLPLLAGTVTAAGLARLEAHPAVAAVTLDRPGGGHLGQSVPALGARQVHETLGLTGEGITIAVVDSGVDSDHPDLADDLVAQHCFTAENCPPWNTDEGASAEDAQGHGSNVAGIITARGVRSQRGFAPDAAIVAVRVLDSRNTGWVSDWVAGLDWLIANHTALDVDIVNMSLGTWALYPANCDAQEPAFAYAVARLHELGVTVFASSGNQGATGAIAAPACLSHVIAVGASYKGDLGREPNEGTYHDWFGGIWPDCADESSGLDRLACFTNRSIMLDLLAPGARITAPYLDGGLATYIGTSQASPTAAGIAALMLEAAPDLAPGEIEAGLRASGPFLFDAANGLSYPRVNALTAVRALLPAPPSILQIQGPNRGSSGITYPFTVTVSPPTATLPLSYAWQVDNQPPLTLSGARFADVQRLVWSEEGVHTVTVSAGNAGGAISATHAITIAHVAPSGLALAGPGTVSTGVATVYTATVSPPDVSLPITYTWHWEGDGRRQALDENTSSAGLRWQQPGAYTVTVTATNRVGTVTATQPVSVRLTAPNSVSISGAVHGATGIVYSLRATVNPITVSQPLTYTWFFGHGEPLQVVGVASQEQTIRWTAPGVYTTTVTVANPGGVVSAEHAISISVAKQIYLPVSRR